MAVVVAPATVAGLQLYLDQPNAAISGVDNLVQLTQRFTPGGTGGLGEVLSTLTVVVQNRNRVPQQTFGPVTITAATPTWVTVQTNTPADSAYFLNLVLDTKTYDYPADFVVLHMSAVAVSGNTYELDVMAPFSSAAGFDEPAGREAYASIQFAHEFFQTRIEGDMWEQFNERQQLRLLLTGSDDLDKEVYKGRKWDYDTPFPTPDATGQVEKYRYRQFPRIVSEFSYLEQFIPGETDAVPQGIKRANCLQALFLGQTFLNRQDPNDRRNLQRFAVTGFNAQGSSESWDLNRQSETRICQAAQDEIRPFILTSAQFGFFD